MEITRYSVDKLQDPTGILEGDRYEFYLYIEVDEEDELYSENGIYAKVIFAVDTKGARIAQYHIYEEVSDQLLDFELEEDEEAMILDFCQNHLEG
ncbi:DUF6509 family protein [Heyndrickxia acidicola]|uniref:DUF6509 family protein n=1 Tax=Heyndrickxia acidicola TaxID=209389 RepID=A0ABU6MCC8_9BACI|nr:DUF6509 family protein [Heyndrickxia acidicola]MED1201666.1 DUF6509 family protein [Heyndrickxia acidicola]